MYNIHGHERIIKRTEEVYGRANDWWGGVRDFHGGHPNSWLTWPGEDFSHLKPSIGYYDDSRPETLEKHIAQATSGGLSFFHFYWYWDANERQEQITQAALNAFLAARNRDAIDFTIGLCAHPFDGLGIPVDQYRAVSKTLVDKYLSQDNTLRTTRGRKILNICDARGLGDGSRADIARFVRTVRERARARLGEEIYVMINHSGFDPARVPAAGGDGAYCTVDGPAVENHDYADYLAGQRAFYQQAPGPYGRCVLADFDERPRYRLEQDDPDKLRWFPDQSLDGFRRALRNVRADIAESSRPNEVDDLVYIYAWNEWHEGGVIEPNVRDGWAYLDVVCAELGLTTGSRCAARSQ